jgi:cysteine synthase A
VFSTKTNEVLCNSILDPIPLVRLGPLSKNSAQVWLKKEWTDPNGPDPIRSIKRKPACLLFSDILEKQYIGKNKMLVSATSGNFGIEVGLLAVSWGYPFYAVVPAVIPEYNLEVLRALGVNVIRTTEQETCPREFTVFYVRGYAHEFHHRLVNLEQYYSWLNPLAHSLTTAKEIFEGAEGEVDYIVAAVGSCGTICGIQQYLAATGRETKIVGVQPEIHHGVPGTHIIKGGCTWSPENYSPAIVPEENIHVADSVDAYAFTAWLWQMGIPAGPSTGMAMTQAYRMVREGATGNIVVISPDSNFKYGDLIADSLAVYGDDIVERYPELELDETIHKYEDHLTESAHMEWMLERVRACYPCEARGDLYRARDIEDIVAGKVGVSAA